MTFHVNYTSTEPNKIEFLGTDFISTPQKRLVYVSVSVCSCIMGMCMCTCALELSNNN